MQVILGSTEMKDTNFANPTLTSYFSKHLPATFQQHIKLFFLQDYKARCNKQKTVWKVIDDSYTSLENGKQINSSEVFLKCLFNFITILISKLAIV